MDETRQEPAYSSENRVPDHGGVNGSQYDGISSSRVKPTSNNVGDLPRAPNGGDLQVVCGPLLNYKRMSSSADTPVWHGSVLIVTKQGNAQPQLELKCLGDLRSSTAGDSAMPQRFEGVKLYQDPDKTFWRFLISLPLQPFEARWQYTIPNMEFVSNVARSPSRAFVVPSASESFRIMFHSCNGFSVGTDEDFWSGPALWNDVLRVHQQRPFHVMIGGGDQIYNDGIRVNGPLKSWTSIANPRKRTAYPFGEGMRAECDKYYADNYIRWYSTEPFASANAQIAQINIWDDHDIIDGFGSYVESFMRCAVFRGIGGVAFKYYCLFQHHLPPPLSTFTTDAKETMHALDGKGTGADPVQMKNTFVLQGEPEDPSWIIGKRPGPYVEERSRSIYMRLGKRMAFVGIDARTERTRHQVNYPDTYDEIFSRLNAEFTAARGDIKHLILLLGVPIAYPRLAWLENLLRSPLIGPIRILNKRFGFAGGFFNNFDGSVDLLDDLDDHYTARQHKTERRELMQRFQILSKQHSVRITILGGDVHLAALGRFYSKPKLNIPIDHDHRYMANVISSAITNKPPPRAVANLLARRNKIHHLDHDTDETLLRLFDKQPGGKEKGATWNKCTMPSRNYATLTEVPPSDVPTLNGATNGTHGQQIGPEPPSHFGNDPHMPLHRGEVGAGTENAVADGIGFGNFAGGLDVSIQVEIDNSNRDGYTEGYGFSSKLHTIPLAVDTEEGSGSMARCGAGTHLEIALIPILLSTGSPAYNADSPILVPTLIPPTQSKFSA